MAKAAVKFPQVPRFLLIIQDAFGWVDEALLPLHILKDALLVLDDAPLQIEDRAVVPRPQSCNQHRPQFVSNVSCEIGSGSGIKNHTSGNVCTWHQNLPLVSMKLK